YKGFKTISVTASGLMAAEKIVEVGVNESTAEVLLQPMTIDLHGLGNPWTNYSYYLTNSFVPAALELMIFLVTVFSICQEIKTGESVQWLARADGSILKALAGKLAPQTVIFFIVGMAIDALLFKFNHFPMNGSWGAMILAMFLFVVACQGFALFITCAIPNLRMALSICSLLGILAFSIAGFSFPVEQMYGAIGIFSYILPIRYYFLIYIDQALNGIPLYYSREYFATLLVFTLAFLPLVPHLKKNVARPVYIL
ncbi:MAG: ABC transporter permease, partial [Muribaculaceae bacterium]|nr:ABC transporter permease [Muribaculaceae bacterium]